MERPFCWLEGGATHLHPLPFWEVTFECLRVLLNVGPEGCTFGRRMEQRASMRRRLFTEWFSRGSFISILRREAASELLMAAPPRLHHANLEVDGLLMFFVGVAKKKRVAQEPGR